MRKSIYNFILSAALPAASLFAGGCTDRLTAVGENKAARECERADVTLRFTCEAAGSPFPTKSSLFEGETISDINLYIWRNGTCILHEYREMDSDTFNIPLVTETSYSFYVLANCGKATEPGEDGWRKDESSMESLAISFPGVSEGTGLLPMAAVLKNRFIGGSALKINVTLVRLVSRIVFSYLPDDSLGASGISITGVRLRDAAQLMTPFSEKSSAADDGVADGDFASEKDLIAINGGGSIEFYAFENCWGNLLAGNTDQKKKVPDELGGVKGPTYIEVSCSFEGSGLLTGKVTYRIYLGSDAVCNFDLVRNSSYRIQLYGSRKGLDEVSWRIDKDVSFNDYLVEWEMTQGAHEADNLYIGEIFLGKLTEIAPSVISYFGDSLEDIAENCRLRCIEDSSGVDGDDPISFSQLEMSSDGEIIFEGTCRRECSGGELWFCDADGGKVSRIAPVMKVNVPEIVFSSESRANMPEPESRTASVTINGEAAGICAYLCDSDGRNLLADDGRGYGFASDVFGMSLTDDSSRWSGAKQAGCISTYLSDEYTGRVGQLYGQPFCCVNLKMSNTGKNSAANSALWTMTGTSGCLNVGIEDKGHSMTGRKPFDVTYFPFAVTFYDKGYGGKDIAAEYGISSGFFFTVSNRSNMSFSFRYLALTQRGAADKPLFGTTTPSGTDIYFFDCPSNLSLPSSMYMLLAEADISTVTSGSFSSCRMTRADDGIAIIGLDKEFYDLIHATETAEAQLTYEKYGYWDSSLSLKTYGFHIKDGISVMVDFASPDNRTISYTFSEELEDSGSESSYVYSNDYNFKGCSYYSANVYKGHSYGESSRVFKNYTYLTPRNISGIMQNVRNIRIGMYTASSPYYTLKTDGAIHNTYIRPTLVCKGFCRTHVNGQKKDPVDYYPETDYVPDVTGSSRPAGTYALARGGIDLLFKEIYDYTFNDSVKKYFKGTPWAHHAHPTEMILDLSFKRVNSYGNWYVYKFENYTPVNLTYDNSGYSAEYDDNPYSVATSVDWETMHGKFSRRIIMVQ